MTQADADTSVDTKTGTSPEGQTDTSAKKAEEAVGIDTSIKEEIIPKVDVEQLRNDLNRSLAIQKDSQKRTSLLERENRKLQSILRGNGQPVTTVDDKGTNQDNSAELIRLNARSGIAELIAYNPTYQNLLSNDETLKHVLKTNPLSLVGDYYDAEDAVNQLQDYLDKRVTSVRSPNITKKEEKSEGKEFKVPVVNPTSVTLSKKEELHKQGRHDEAVEEGIKSRINFG